RALRNAASIPATYRASGRGGSHAFGAGRADVRRCPLGLFCPSESDSSNPHAIQIERENRQSSQSPARIAASAARIRELVLSASFGPSAEDTDRRALRGRIDQLRRISLESGHPKRSATRATAFQLATEGY